MPNILKPIWSFMQKIGRFLKNTWASMSAYVLYIRVRFASKPDGFEETMNRIRANDPQLTHVNLSWKKLSYWNIIELCYALASNTSLTSLNVSWNRMGAAGAQALAQALSTNTTLTSLNVCGNDIGATEAQALAANTTLTSLNVRWNMIGDAGAQALAQALVTNTTLTSLDVCGNEIGEAGAQALAANTTLTSLNVSWNRIGDAGAQALAANTTLTSLDVSENEIGAAGAQALSMNTTLTSLNVDYNQVGPVNRLLLTNAIIRNIETKKTMARLHAFASIANNDHQSPQRLFEDIVQEVCSFLTTDAECLTNIRLRAAERSSRHVLFQPAGTVDSTQEPIQSASTNNVQRGVTL